MWKLTGLLCLAFMLSVPPIAHAAEPPSKWSFFQGEDTMTDEISIMAALSNGTDLIVLRCWPSKPEAGIAIVFVPKDGITRLASIDRAYLSTRYAAGTRFDNDAATLGVFVLDGKNLRLEDNIVNADEKLGLKQNDPRVMRFLDRFVRAGRLRIRFEQLDGTSGNWEFDLAGAGEAIDHLGNSCPKNAWLSKD